MPLPPGFEHTPCPLCGSDNPRIVLKRRDLMLASEGEFTVCQCGECAHQYLNPRPTRETIGQHYRGAYDQHLVHAQAGRLKRLDQGYGHWKRLRLIERYVPGGVLLDVGCGGGGFLAEVAKRPNWRAVGIEPSPAAAAACREQLGLNVLASTWEEADLPRESADAITMWEVLEHLHAPVAAVSKAQHLLKPGGLLIISTPNRDSLDARTFGPCWIGYELPRHLQIFRQADVEGLLTANGFEVVATPPPDGAFFAFNTSLRFHLRNRGAPAWLQKAIFSLPLRAAQTPFFWLTSRLRLSSSLTTVARKLP